LYYKKFYVKLQMIKYRLFVFLHQGQGASFAPWPTFITEYGKRSGDAALFGAIPGLCETNLMQKDRGRLQMAKSGDDKKSGNKKPEAEKVPLKTDFHAQADETNQVYRQASGKYVLICGTTRKGKICKSYAGRGTSHPGYGRCLNHGGCSTGPITPEGKAISAQNSRVHGLYSKVLLPHEQKIFDQLYASKDLGLEGEILLLKTKILSYLEEWRYKYLNNYQDAKRVGANEDLAQDFAKKKTEVWASFVSEAGSTTGKTCYQAATIEDRALDRSLRTLANMVEKHARLNGTSGDDLINQINTELRAASFGKVGLSWSGGPPQRVPGGGARDE
jgi:hypothetical protein